MAQLAYHIPLAKMTLAHRWLPTVAQRRSHQVAQRWATGVVLSGQQPEIANPFICWNLPYTDASPWSCADNIPPKHNHQKTTQQEHRRCSHHSKLVEASLSIHVHQNLGPSLLSTHMSHTTVKDSNSVTTRCY